MKTELQNLIVYVDVDDTLIRSSGSKRIPISGAVEHVKQLHQAGAQLYLWSSGGGDYARSAADELGLTHCFVAFLPKPHVLLDDQHPSEWRRLMHRHPFEVMGKSVEEYVADDSPSA